MIILFIPLRKHVHIGLAQQCHHVHLGESLQLAALITETLFERRPLSQAAFVIFLPHVEVYTIELGQGVGAAGQQNNEDTK